MRLGTAIERLVEAYNYASGKEWIQDKVAWALYQTWKEADDRKTEPQNYCDDCLYTDTCDSKAYFYACTSKATISKMEQVEEPMKTTDYCDICKRDLCENCVTDATNPYCVPSLYEINYEPKDEPQTERSE